jgi:hypothetical protein
VCANSSFGQREELKIKAFVNGGLSKVFTSKRERERERENNVKKIFYNVDRYNLFYFGNEIKGEMDETKSTQWQMRSMNKFLNCKF